MLTMEELEIKEKEIAEKIKAIPSINGCFPVIDGIIDIERYINAKYKILWILKEANFGKSKGSWDMLAYYREAKESDINKSLTTRRVMLVSHRFFPDVTPLSAFQSIAYINIKKVAGYENSDDTEIEKAFSAHKCLLLEQIETYNPDIIICGNTLNYFENDLDFRKGESISIGMEQRHYFCSKERLYINAFHPAYPKITDEEYSDKIFNAFSYWVSKK